jgi:hypothetical protein
MKESKVDYLLRCNGVPQDVVVHEHVWNIPGELCMRHRSGRMRVGRSHVNATSPMTSNTMRMPHHRGRLHL